MSIDNIISLEVLQMEKQFLLVRITDLAGNKDTLGFSILVHDVEKMGYVCYKGSIFENYLVLRYSDPERLYATSNILKQKGVTVKIRETIKEKIHPLTIGRLPLGGNTK